jgi:beta-lactamase class A
MLYVARMTICSIGVGVLVGTVLSAWDPANRAPADASTQTSTVSTPISTPAATPTAVLPGQDLSALQSTVEALATKYSASNPALVASAYVLDVDTNSHVDVNGSVSLAAASVIKVPILVAFLQAVDSGKIRLDESLVMRKELVAQEAGDMQYRPVGSKFSAIETATKMITISDNTATNILIERLGGTAVLNEQFKSWGLANTVLANLLPDVEGTNLTSTKDMTLLLARISKGELLSARSRDRLLDILRKTINNSMLPQGIEHGSTIAHKTGTIAISVGDVGLVDLPNGKRYAISALVKRAPNDRRAINLIQQTSRAVYQHFIQPPTPPLANPSPVTQSHLHQTTTSDRSATQKQANQP